MAISDSHSFGTKEAFNTAVFKQNPDFILQLGDIIEGTGTQKDQFEFWLNSGDFIHYYPIVYACGNHDYGTYYDWYITYPQKLAFGETIDGNISFDYGEDMHFALMDSNPWGLLQMNTETSGGTLDSATAAKIEAIQRMAC